MIQGTGGASFPPESLEPFRVVGEGSGKDLDGHVPIQTRVPRPVDLSVMKPHEDGAVVCLKSSLKPVTLRPRSPRQTAE